MFYRPGGAGNRINAQYDEIYADFIGATTGWLPVSQGNVIGVNISRASIAFNTSAQSTVTKTAFAGEYTALLEMKTIGGQLSAEAWPIDQWQNVVVATSRSANRDGYIRLRIVNLNNLDGTGLAMALQVSRTGDTGAVR